MADPNTRKELLATVKDALASLAAIDAKSLARTSDLSPDINFKDAVPYFEEMLDLCKQLNQRELSRLTTPQLNAIAGTCKKINSYIKQVQEFTLNQDRPGDVCNDIIRQIESAYDDVMNPLLLPLAFTATQATDYAKIEREAKGYHTTMKTEAEKLSAFIANARQEAQNALAAVKEQAAEAGVSTNAQIFLKEAEEHGKLAGKWLLATIAAAVVTLIAALIGLVVAVKWQPPTTAAAIQYVAAKLIVLSTLSFAVFWCARNYKAQKHNETVNKHRANALMTFRAFVEGTSDDRVKDAILLQASQAAFTGRPTGYDSPDKDSQTINPVVEIIGKTLPKATDAAG